MHIAFSEISAVVVLTSLEMKIETETRPRKDVVDFEMRDLQKMVSRSKTDHKRYNTTVSTSKVPSWKGMDCFYQVWNEVPPYVKEYLWVFLTNLGETKSKVNRRICAARAGMQVLYWTVVVPTFTYGRELWVLTKERDCRYERLKRISFEGWLDSSLEMNIWWKHAIEPLLPHVKGAR